MKKLGILVWLAAWGNYCSGAKDVAPLVSPETIRAVRVGMTQEEVVSILGQPYKKLTGTRQDRPSWEDWEYSRPAWLTYQYPMLWVHFEKSRVVGVSGKKYVLWGIDDDGVYGVSRGVPDFETQDFEPTFCLEPERIRA